MDKFDINDEYYAECYSEDLECLRKPIKLNIDFIDLNNIQDIDIKFNFNTLLKNQDTTINKDIIYNYLYTVKEYDIFYFLNLLTYNLLYKKLQKIKIIILLMKLIFIHIIIKNFIGKLKE